MLAAQVRLLLDTSEIAAKLQLFGIGNEVIKHFYEVGLNAGVV
jgi:hypothetical protein